MLAAEEKNAVRDNTSINDYAEELKQLIRDEQERIGRILRRIDESSEAIGKSRRLIRGV